LVTAGDPAAGAPIAAKVGDGHGDDGPSGDRVHPGGEPERSAAKGFGGVRSGAAAAVAVLVLAVAGAATALAITSGSGPSPVASTTSGRPPATKTTTSTPPAPTPTVVQTSLQPSSAVAGGATYPTRGQSLHLTLTATGPCWIEVRATPTSPVIWTGTLQAGMSHTILGTGSMWVRVGEAAHIGLTMNGLAVVTGKPSPGPSPYNFTFAPTAA
ncbi:MAG: DUF4115 domain-containing protein, partial [Acidimicrobiales bacterium]